MSEGQYFQGGKTYHGLNVNFASLPNGTFLHYYLHEYLQVQILKLIQQSFNPHPMLKCICAVCSLACYTPGITISCISTQVIFIEGFNEMVLELMIYNLT